MRNFDYDESDESAQKEVDGFFSEQDERDQFIELSHVGMEQKGLKMDLVAISLGLLEKSFFWKFRSTKSKLKLLLATYRTLTHLL